ncbi:helix-turn-helix domain-containing protein [Calothrix sp. CCY 0018]|uniref:helix-turn-helix domain-containing protein n=1 Tax=Calothrix sp. CCY 0018 TaxID=3103864 RepID=UPI0039C5BC83
MESERLSAIEVVSGNLIPVAYKPPIISGASSWEDISVEQHHLPAFESPEICLQQHSIAIQLGSSYQIDWRLAGGKLHTTQMRKGVIGITPKSVPTQARWFEDVDFLLISLNSNLFHKVYGDSIDCDSIEIIPQRGVDDSQIFHLGMALKGEITARCPSGNIFAESIATALAIRILKNYSSVNIKITKSEIQLSQQQLQQVIDYIHDNLALKLSLKELAILVSMSSYNFCRWFKNSMGISPHQYIIQCRIKRAKYLLAYTKLPLVDIALNIGCSSQTNFTVLFRKHMGITPRAYKNQF